MRKCSIRKSLVTAGSGILLRTRSWHAAAARRSDVNCAIYTQPRVSRACRYAHASCLCALRTVIGASPAWAWGWCELYGSLPSLRAQRERACARNRIWMFFSPRPPKSARHEMRSSFARFHPCLSRGALEGHASPHGATAALWRIRHPQRSHMARCNWQCVSAVLLPFTSGMT